MLTAKMIGEAGQTAIGCVLSEHVVTELRTCAAELAYPNADRAGRALDDPMMGAIPGLRLSVTIALRLLSHHSHRRGA